MFEVLYQTGIRSSELINLLEINVSNDQIKVLGKRNKERIIPITISLSALIEKYRVLRLKITVQGAQFFYLKKW